MKLMFIVLTSVVSLMGVTPPSCNNSRPYMYIDSDKQLYLNVLKQNIQHGTPLSIIMKKVQEYSDDMKGALVYQLLDQEKQSNQEISIIKSLLKEGLNPNLTNQETGETLIHVAVRHRNLILTETLLKNPNSSILYTNNKGLNPLLCASQSSPRNRKKAESFLDQFQKLIKKYNK